MPVRHPITRRLAPVVAALLLAACATSETRPPPKVVELPSEPRAIVRLLPDRTLEVTTLVSPRGSRVSAVRIVPPEHRDYAALLSLLQGARPGDARPVPVDAGTP